MLKIRSVWKAEELKRFKELEKKYHYRPLLAETFCDVEHSAGTCYKAAGWIPLGMTKGFTRTNRQECDFYVPNGNPHLGKRPRSFGKKNTVLLVKERGLFS